MVEQAHAAGIKVMPFVTTVAEARRAVALGADAVAVQGAEAGGYAARSSSVRTARCR